MKTLGKIWISLFILGFCFDNLNAQWRLGETVSDAYTTVSISAGPTFADGHYKGKPNFDRAGFAKLGYMVQVDASFAILENAGVAISGGYFSNAINKEQFGRFSIPGGLSDLVDFDQIEIDPWTHFFFGVGPSLSFPEEFAVLELKALVGALYTTDATGTFNSAGNQYSFTRSDAVSLSLDLKLGMHYRFADQYRLIAELHYLAAAPNFDYTYDLRDSLQEWQADLQRDQGISVFAFTLGAGMEF